MTPFLVLTLPRSRSFWLSKFLDCPHDPSRHFATAADVAAYFSDGACGVDTALGLIWADMARYVRADLRIAVVHRAVPDVLASLARIGIAGPNLPGAMHRMADALLRIRGAHFAYSQLATRDGAARLFHYCLGRGFSDDWWTTMKDRRLEANLLQTVADAAANPGFGQLFGVAA